MASNEGGPPPLTQFRHAAVVLERLRELALRIDATWLEAARAALAAAGQGGEQIPTPEEAMGHVISRLGWRVGDCEFVVPLRKLSVRVATQLQLQAEGIPKRRAALAADYVREACGWPAGTEGPLLEEKVKGFWEGQRRRWRRVKWEPVYKETLWRLALDAVPLAGNTHMRNNRVPEACGCGGYGRAAGLTASSPRAHHFWDCPVAQAVSRQIEGHLAGSLHRAHVWLGSPPEGCEQSAWDVIAMAALTAMETGRVKLRAAQRGGGAATVGEGTPLQRACTKAAARFWEALHSFAALGIPKKGWEKVGACHPILSVSDGRIRCAEPLAVGGEMVLAGAAVLGGAYWPAAVEMEDGPLTAAAARG